MLITVTSGLCGFGRWDDGGQSVGHGSHCGGIRFPRWALEAGHRERSIRGRSIHTSGSDSKVPIRWGKLKVPIPLGTTQSTHSAGDHSKYPYAGDSSKYPCLWGKFKVLIPLGQEPITRYWAVQITYFTWPLPQYPRLWGIHGWILTGHSVSGITNFTGPAARCSGVRRRMLG